MKNPRKIQTWWDIYLCLHENGRARITDICRKINYTGRGKNRDTIRQYLNEAFEKGIITRPRLTLENHEGSTLYAYLVKGVESRTELFEQLTKNEDILYMTLLNGEYQLFFTSHSPSISVPYHCELSPIFRPLYTRPDGWNASEQECMDVVITQPYKAGSLPRRVLGPLDWDALDWQIYTILRRDMRKSLKEVAELLNTTYETVRLHLFEKVLPSTLQSVGFFPKGFINYSHVFFLAKTPCEHSFVTALSKLQTSCLVWPLEDRLMCLVYFQNLNFFLKTIFLLEKREIFREYYFLLPLEYLESGG